MISDPTQHPDPIRRRYAIAAIALILVGAARVAAILTVFSATADEGVHLTAGLQILAEHRYSLHLVNPPLPRVVTAFGPTLAGARYDPGQDIIEQARAKFHSTGHYRTLLALARAGTLAFFLLGAAATWLWARRELGDAAALLALFFFTTQPSLLAHSGLATLDVAGTAGFAVCMLAFSRWLAAPSPRRAVVLGLAYGFAISCKLLCIAYAPIACAAIGVVRLMGDAETRARWRSAATLAIVASVGALTVWAGYGFSVGTIATLDPIARAFPNEWPSHLLRRLDPSFPVPAPAFFRGIAEVVEGNRAGMFSYALGRLSAEGWWWYFPLALALKTTLATLIAVTIGFFVSPRSRRFLEPLAATGAILALSMTTRVDLGVRYILPIYVPLSLAAGAATLAALHGRRVAVRRFAAAILAWQILASALAHPHYLAYFNELAWPSPSYYLVDSNLDWGQDLLRLRDVVRRERIDSLGVSLFGGADLQLLGFPPHYEVDAFTPTHGSIAVSESSYRVTRVRGGWRWLAGRPYRRVGKSIRLYEIP
jgi:4-amino-4-deoxy-L-arabinose transferase-like glycosyltransferase